MPKIIQNEEVLRIGKLLKQRREDIGISREALAEKLGTSYESIRLYEEGQRVMKLDRLCELLDALGVPPSECFSLKLRDGVTVNPETLRLAERLETLDSALYSKVIRQINSLIDFAKGE